MIIYVAHLLVGTHECAPYMNTLVLYMQKTVFSDLLKTASEPFTLRT